MSMTHCSLWRTSYPGNGLPVGRTAIPATVSTWPDSCRGSPGALFLPGGAVLSGRHRVHLFPSSGHCLFIIILLLFIGYARDEPVSLRTAWCPGRPGGGRPATNLHYQQPPAEGTRAKGFGERVNNAWSTMKERKSTQAILKSF